MTGGTQRSSCGAPGHKGADSPPDHEVRLEGFVLEVLGSSARRSGADSGDAEERDALVDRALGRYLADRELAPPGWACIPLSASEVRHGAPPLTVHLQESRHREICAEATSQGVSIETLVAHALMYAWAAEADGR